MSTISKNLKPITLNEYENSLKNDFSSFQNKNHTSLYITRAGNIINCRFPEYLGHSEVSRNIYENLHELKDFVEVDSTRCPFGSSCALQYLSEEDTPTIEDIQSILLESAGIPDNQDDYSMYIKRKNLSDEDLPVHDLGFVRVAINADKVLTLVVPASIYNGYTINSTQKETLSKVLELHNFKDANLTARLYGLSRECSREAAEIQSKYPQM